MPREVRLGADAVPVPPLAFYTVADARHFLGAVALLNSLRLVGHHEPLYIVDCGLTDTQRTLLGSHAELLDVSSGFPPMLLKQSGPLARPAQAMVVLDADVIVTRSLASLVREARSGRIVVFENDQSDRFFPEWATLLGLSQPIRRAYVASGHLIVAGDLGMRLLGLLETYQARVDLRLTLLGAGEPGDPFYYPDMDVLNALLASEFSGDDVRVVSYRLAPHAPFDGLELVDENTPCCRYADGSEPYVLHHVLRKPWLAATRANVYSRLLPRLLQGGDVALRLDDDLVPLRLRRGSLAAVDRRRVDVQASLRKHVRGRVGIRRRLDARRRAHLRTAVETERRG